MKFSDFVLAKILDGIAQLEHSRRRALLLQAYRQRRSWRKADARPLETLGAGRAARLRIAKLKATTQRGPGVIAKPISLDEHADALLSAVKIWATPQRLRTSDGHFTRRHVGFRNGWRQPIAASMRI